MYYLVFSTRNAKPSSHSCGNLQAMLQDLLTIRADRDNYYFGCDALFARHPELIHRLCFLTVWNSEVVLLASFGIDFSTYISHYETVHD